MEKTDIIKEAYTKKEEESKKHFIEQVQRLVYDIEQTSGTLQKLKKELTELQYNKPEAIGNLV